MSCACKKVYPLVSVHLTCQTCDRCLTTPWNCTFDFFLCFWLVQNNLPCYSMNEASVLKLLSLLFWEITSTKNQPWIFIGRTDAEAPILWPPDSKSWFIGKNPDARKDWGQEEKGVRQDEVVQRHHQFNGHEYEQTPGDTEGQGSLACWAYGVNSDTTGRLKNSFSYISCYSELWNSKAPWWNRSLKRAVLKWAIPIHFHLLGLFFGFWGFFLSLLACPRYF